jgi:hypothetical protein
LNDGLNIGSISQFGPDLTLSSSGNKIALASNHTLVFKNDNTTQLTAYTAREIVDDCDTHTYMHNIAYPTTPRFMLSSTFALNQGAPTTSSIVVGNTYAYPVRLVKGQVVSGAGFFLSVSGSPQIGYALYNTDSSYSRVAATSAYTNVPTNGMNYLPYSPTSYTVPRTGVYYTCIYANSVGSGLSVIAMPTNTYLNYGLPTMTTGVLNKAAQRATTASGPPSTMSGVAMTLLDSVAYSVVYAS